MEGDNELGLNSSHENELLCYLKFCRRQRSERLRSIKASFFDAKDARLNEETYTKEEVEDLLENLSEIICNEVETELLHDAHSNSILVMSLFAQAQKWHLDLTIDIASLENQEKLASIKNFEKSGAQKHNSPLKKLHKLSPIQGEKGGPTSLLEAHIQRLNEEKIQLLSRIKELEAKVISLTLEKENLQLDKTASDKEINLLKTAHSSSNEGKGKISLMSGEIQNMRLEISSKEENFKEETESLKSNLQETERALMQIQSQLMLAEKELEKKFSQTGAYQNMKKILSNKNSQLKQLRQRLEKYEPLQEESEIAFID